MSRRAGPSYQSAPRRAEDQICQMPRLVAARPGRLAIGQAVCDCSQLPPSDAGIIHRPPTTGTGARCNSLQFRRNTKSEAEGRRGPGRYAPVSFLFPPCFLPVSSFSCCCSRLHNVGTRTRGRHGRWGECTALTIHQALQMTRAVVKFQVNVSPNIVPKRRHKLTDIMLRHVRHSPPQLMAAGRYVISAL